MNIKDAKFISPVNKGDTFSFNDLLKVDKNQKIFDQLISEEINEKITNLKKQITLEAKEKMYTKVKLEVETQKKIISLEEKEKVSEKLNELKGKLNSFDQMKNEIIKSKDHQIQKSYDQLEKLQKSFEVLNSELQKKYEDQLNNQIKLIQDEFTKKEQDLISKTSNKIGEEGEDFVRNELIRVFESDKITKPNHATGGADIEQIIMDINKKIATIYFEVKNKKNWSYADYENFASKVRNRDDDISIFIAKTMPKSTKEKHLIKINDLLFYDKISNVYIVETTNFLSLTFALRTLTIKYNKELNKQDNIKNIHEKIYDFISSDEFNNFFKIIKSNIRELELIFKNIQSQTTKGIGESKNIEIQVNNLIEIVERKINN